MNICFISLGCDKNLRAGMADRHRTVLGQQQRRHRLSYNIAAPDDDG